MDAIELILKLHKADGTEPISRVPGLWHHRLDDQWEFWINGHMEPQGGEEIAQKLAPGECYVKFNGWPAGLFSIITGDGVIAAGEIANYEAFCAALRGAIAA